MGDLVFSEHLLHAMRRVGWVYLTNSKLLTAVLRGGENTHQFCRSRWGDPENLSMDLHITQL